MVKLTTEGLMKKLIFLKFIMVYTLMSFSQSLNAVITVDGYQWLSNGTPIDMNTRFPGGTLTRNFAPLPVFFQGWKSEPRESIVDYVWDFGDGSEVFHGFNAGHVYEIPGNYTATLSVTDTLGRTNSETILIEVLERTGKTYFIDSEIGSDSYNGLSQTFTGGSNGPWKTADKAFSEMATELYQSGDQILFKRGQTFELTVSNITPGAWPAWGYAFGTFGTGTKPVIQYKGQNDAIIIHMYSIGLAHISFTDLDFRFDDYAGHKASVFFFAQGGATRNILFLRVDALDLYSDLFTIGQYMDYEISSGTFLINSSIRNTYIDPLKNSTLFAVWGSRVVLLNNYFDLSGNHIGYTAIDKGVVAGNTFSRPAFGRTALRICGFQEEGYDWNTNLTSNNVQVSENYFHGWIDPETEGRAHNGEGNQYNYLLVQFSPNGPWNQIIRDITFERNVITNGNGMLNIGAAENITVRNNILISNTQNGYHIEISDANKPSKNIKILGNTFIARNAQYSGNIYEMSGMIKILKNNTQTTHPFDYTNHQEISIKNNIFYINGTNSFSRFLYIDDIDEVLPQVKCDNNLYFVNQGSSDGEFFQIGNSALATPTAQYLTLQQWQSQQNQDISGIYADPQFVNLSGTDGQFSEYGFDADLRLLETSSARGIGKVDKVNSFYDFNKFQRFGNNQTVDLGALEYGSGSVVSVNSESETPKSFLLSQNYPNPFNPSTMISYQLPINSFVNLRVFDILGREVATLVNEQKPAGNYEMKFDASNLASGVYLYKLQAGDYSSVKKLILMK